MVGQNSTGLCQERAVVSHGIAPWNIKQYYPWEFGGRLRRRVRSRSESGQTVWRSKPQDQLIEDEDERLALTRLLRARTDRRQIKERRFARGRATASRRAAGQWRGEGFRGQVQGSDRCRDHCRDRSRMDRCLYRCRDRCRQ